MIRVPCSGPSTTGRGARGGRAEQQRGERQARGSEAEGHARISPCRAHASRQLSPSPGQNPPCASPWVRRRPLLEPQPMIRFGRARELPARRDAAGRDRLRARRVDPAPRTFRTSWKVQWPTTPTPVARLPRNRLPSRHALPHARGPAAEGAADPGAVGRGRPLQRHAQGAAGGRRAALRAARRPALRQRRHPHRPRAAKDPEGLRGPLALRCWATTSTTCPAGTATACRSSGRSRRSSAPRAGARTRSPRPSSAPAAATTPPTGSSVQMAEFKRLGVIGDWEHRYATMDYRERGGHRRRVPQVRGLGPALPRLQAGDVEPGRAHGAGRRRGRVPRPRLARRSGSSSR